MRSVCGLLVLITLGVLPATSSAETGRAMIRSTGGSTLSGEVTLKDTKKGLQIVARIANITGDLPGLVPNAPELTQGKHGFHIHEFGNCNEGGKAAGGHFNPTGAEHGYLPKDGLEKSHAGDLGNLEIGSKGSGTLKITVSDLTLSGGPYAVAGRAIILHADPDDFGQPTGNAGDRIGCGVIFITSD